MHKYRSWIELDESALQNNVAQLRSLLAPGTRFCAVVKANAYGHGQKEVVNIVARSGIDAFAVDSIDDALAIRQRLPSALILVLGYTMLDRFSEALDANVHLTMYDRESVRSYEATAAERSKTGSIHLKLETGTNRQGIVESELNAMFDQLRSSPHLSLAGLSTHFANIEDASDPAYATKQFSRFQSYVQWVAEAGFHPPLLHCACSAAAILYPDTHLTFVRAGISLYGLWPSELVELTARRHSVKCELQPVLTWKTRIAQTKSVDAGEPIGYGLSERVSRQSRIAILPIGYWDGYDRRLSSIGYVLVKGHRCKVLGRVCMNMTMIDVSAVPNVLPEDEVVLLGRSGIHSISVEEMATWAGTVHYEILARLNPLLPRIVV